MFGLFGSSFAVALLQSYPPLRFPHSGLADKLRPEQRQANLDYLLEQKATRIEILKELARRLKLPVTEKFDEVATRRLYLGLAKIIIKSVKPDILSQLSLQSLTAAWSYAFSDLDGVKIIYAIATDLSLLYAQMLENAGSPMRWTIYQRDAKGRVDKNNSIYGEPVLITASGDHYAIIGELSRGFGYLRKSNLESDWIFTRMNMEYWADASRFSTQKAAQPSAQTVAVPTPWIRDKKTWEAQMAALKAIPKPKPRTLEEINAEIAALNQNIFKFSMIAKERAKYTFDAGDYQPIKLGKLPFAHNEHDQIQAFNKAILKLREERLVEIQKLLKTQGLEPAPTERFWNKVGYWIDKNVEANKEKGRPEFEDILEDFTQLCGFRPLWMSILTDLSLLKLDHLSTAFSGKMALSDAEIKLAPKDHRNELMVRVSLTRRIEDDMTGRTLQDVHYFPLSTVVFPFAEYTALKNLGFEDPDTVQLGEEFRMLEELSSMRISAEGN